MTSADHVIISLGDIADHTNTGNKNNNKIAKGLFLKCGICLFAFFMNNLSNVFIVLKFLSNLLPKLS